MLYAAGVTAGGFAACKTLAATIYEYFSGLSGGALSPMTGTAALNAVIVWAVLFFSAFFRFGTITAMLTVLTKGFINGYAITAILRIYGFHGLTLAFRDVFYLPLFIYMAASSVYELSDTGAGTRFTTRSILILILMVIASVSGAVLSSLTAKQFLPLLKS